MKALLPIILLFSLVAPAKAEQMVSRDIGLYNCKSLVEHYEAWKKNSNSYKGAIYKAYVYGKMDDGNRVLIQNNLGTDEVLYLIGVGAKKLIKKPFFGPNYYLSNCFDLSYEYILSIHFPQYYECNGPAGYCWD